MLVENHRGGLIANSESREYHFLSHFIIQGLVTWLQLTATQSGNVIWLCASNERGWLGNSWPVCQLA